MRIPMKKILAVACSAAILAAVAGCSSETSSPDASASPTTSAAPASPSATEAGPMSSPSPTSAIAAGFPEALVPVFAGSQPAASSYESEAGLVTASMTASSSADADEILAFYTAHFEELGFTALDGDAVDSTPAKDFARTADTETETVNVSVITRNGSSIYTVGANVLPATVESAGQDTP
ncbi:hypothetical protein ITX31_12085 [Arthrobacter gandavensis]|uniref:hypothetical protein n=1 Tax=Arthrobacter gandavensis TaxID=169960 RepID=UPI00188F256B|nr:hypothetical protein [Arthrobacter gandavensis]MBF4994846.1 hypothetical protein [Arthrobacter gandavensis]